MATRRRSITPTTTSAFGSGAREGHDATPFYDRFRPPELSDDDTVAPPEPVAEPFVCGDARSMTAVADNSVALVVTSPPYFAGKQYELELQREGIPATYLEYLAMLTEVFAECVRTLEPGGRLAVNVANLGRKPYRSLSADVIRILEHDLGLLLRGELIWQKAEGATGSCAWGSFRSAANPVLRDVSERVIVASKGRFDRARTARQRKAQGLPHESTVNTDDFLALTLDVWSMPAESARRVGHPAPFPVELPEQLIRLYTYADDLVLDPFMGSGSTLVAASRLGRRYVGYDLDPDYVALARRRVADEGGAAPAGGPGPAPAGEGGPTAARLAEAVLADAGFAVAERDRRIRGTGVAVDLVVHDADGQPWWILVCGVHTAHRPGMARPEVTWKALGRAAALHRSRGDVPLLLVSPQVPRPRSEGDAALRAAGPGLVSDVVDLLDAGGRERLGRYARGGYGELPLPGFWTGRDLGRDSGRDSGREGQPR
ncbi:MAG: site-specific DNA-methyltransferase [Acidimicrobiales bacterium]